MTTPLNLVATASLACTLVPTGVFPASTLCCISTGNSRREEEEGAVDFCWPRARIPQSAIITASTDKVRIDMIYSLGSERILANPLPVSLQIRSTKKDCSHLIGCEQSNNRAITTLSSRSHMSASRTKVNLRLEVNLPGELDESRRVGRGELAEGTLTEVVVNGCG
jgi:hypothetical protein